MPAIPYDSTVEFIAGDLHAGYISNTFPLRALVINHSPFELGDLSSPIYDSSSSVIIISKPIDGFQANISRSGKFRFSGTSWIKSTLLNTSVVIGCKFDATSFPLGPLTVEYADDTSPTEFERLGLITIQPTPTVTSFSPSVSSTFGNAEITVIGSNFNSIVSTYAVFVHSGMGLNIPIDVISDTELHFGTFADFFGSENILIFPKGTPSINTESIIPFTIRMSSGYDLVSDSVEWSIQYLHIPTISGCTPESGVAGTIVNITVTNIQCGWTMCVISRDTSPTESIDPYMCSSTGYMICIIPLLSNMERSSIIGVNVAMNQLYIDSAVQFEYIAAITAITSLRYEPVTRVITINGIALDTVDQILVGSPDNIISSITLQTDDTTVSTSFEYDAAYHRCSYWYIS